VLRVLGVAGTPGKRDHHRDAQPLGEAHSLAEDLVVVGGNRRVRVDRIAMTRKRADGEPGAVDPALVLRRAVFADEQFVDVQVVAARPSAGADLDRLDAERPHLGDHVRRAERPEDGSEESELHRVCPPGQYGTSVQALPAW
jgi:hypothetical protein